ncbi:MAG: sigma-70 family RNA polymerase sigma factor [Desulfobacterales bacterium]|nr:sigma-70 family RNA polymerase sigma factor [Desulfobacterales bacterium]
MEKPNPQRITDADSDLIRAINEGQNDRFYELVRKYEGRLYSFSMKVCGNVQDAEDLVQDTFLTVFRYIGDFRFETRFKNWLYRIATSACLKKKRRSKFAPERELSLEDFLPGENEPRPSETPRWARTPSEKLLDEELAQTLNQAILDLPEKYRMVVVLRDVEGFSTEETAQILQLSASNVKVRLHRARLSLRETLKGYFEDAP